MEKVVIDAQVLFYFHYTYDKVPTLLQDLKKSVIEGKITAIIPTIAISELLWKLRKHEKADILNKAIARWQKSENVIIDPFDIELINLMIKNKESHELHDEIIAMTCQKHNTKIIYSTDQKFKTIFNLDLRSWK